MLLPEATDEDTTSALRQISAPVCVKVEPVGRWFQAYVSRRHHRRTLSHTDDYSSSGSSDISDDEALEDEDEAFLLSLDPKEWKDQDHYKVLGIGKLRYRATDEQIKKAHKKKVLKHHPDKRKGSMEPRKDGDDDYFSCITKAYEILGNPQKRKSYDSVDPEFDDFVPFANQESKDNFYKVFTPVFNRNARWSNKKRVPKLGDKDASRDDVMDFYDFWYEFDSWREYSYQDEEEKEKGQDRDERKWIDKQNKIARQKKKKEEMARIRQLVDNAYACDPRIKQFKENEKRRREEEKKAKQEAARLAAEEKERERQAVLEAERLAKEKEEEEAKAKALAAKKEKEAHKKALKKERKLLRETCKKYSYFTNDDAEAVRQMQEVEKICEKLDLMSLQKFNAELQGPEEEAKKAYLFKVEDVNRQIEQEKQEMLQTKKGSSSGGGSQSSKQWSDEDLQLLIKAVNLFPAGTVSRWEVTANFINQHSTSGVRRNAKDVINKAKNLQKLDPSLKDDANKKAFDKFEQSKTKKDTSADVAVPSQRFNGGAGAASASETQAEQKPWTGEEQKALEQGIKTFGANTPDRWDRIAEAVPTRTKKECMKRYKDLVEMVKAKKAAQAHAAKTKKS
ncbi:dnaJ homolog subfamily C member 2-like [Ptychodera flava]|uniref:dnaJ homolog subfamily C member 2-like n=1 Tax=Ptychodera flava TaxID=63121 RepID=UPI00396A74A0